MSKEIVAEIKGGKITYETRGFKGRACQDATAGLDAALGALKESDTPTPEWHEVEVRTITN